MKRIVYLFEHPTVSGAEGSALDLLSHLDREEFDPVPFAPPHGELASRLAALGLPPRPWRVPRSAGDEEALARRLAREDPAILHANTVQLGRLTGRVAVRCGARGVAHVRAFGSFNARTRRSLRGNRFLIAVSEAVRSHLVDQGIPSEKIRVIYNGVSLPAVSAGPGIREQLGLAAGSRLVAWLGQITVRKGPDILLEVAKRCVLTLPDVHILVLGDVFGEKQENLELKRALLRASAAEPLRTRLHVLGWREDAFTILSQATVLLHTARQEPLSRVLIEALAAGTPIVATRVGGTAEVVGECGILFEPSDADAGARALADILGDAATQARLREAGKERWRTRFQADRMAREVADTWRTACRIDDEEEGCVRGSV